MSDGAAGKQVSQPAGGKRTHYLVTGADGFTGREISAQLRALGYPVRGLVRRKKAHVPMPDGVELIFGDVLRPDSLDALFDGLAPQTAVFIHTAAVVSVRKRNTGCEQVNLSGTKNIIEACRRHGVRRLVHFASVDALPPRAAGDPATEPDRFVPEDLITSYGRSKAAGAQLVLDAAAEGLSCAVLLPSAIIGPGDYRNGFLTQMIGLYLSGLPRLSVRGGYDFVDVRDVASAAIAASSGSGRGDVYILSNTYADVTRVFDIIAAHTGRKPTLCTLPGWALYPLVPFVAAACRFSGKEPPLTAETVRLLGAHPVYCHDKAARELGFSPRVLEQTLADTAAFLLNQRAR